MARFEETVNIQPTTFNTGAAQGLLSVADTIEQFKQTTTAYAQQAAQKRGELSAQGITFGKDESGITKKPEYKKEKLFGRIEAQAHNTALKNAYLSSIDTDTREAVNRIAIENPDDVIKFNEAARGYTNGVLKGVDPSVRQQVSLDLENKFSYARSNVLSAQYKRQDKETTDAIILNIETAADSAGSYARNGDRLAAIDEKQKALMSIEALVEKGAITSAEGTRKWHEIEKNTIKQGYIHDVDILSDSDIDKAYELVDDLQENIPKGWGPEEWDSFTSSLGSYVKNKQSAIKASQKAEEDALKQLNQEKSDNWEQSALEKLNAGKLTMVDVLSAPLMKEDTRQQWYNRLLSYQEDVTKKLSEKEKLQEQKQTSESKAEIVSNMGGWTDAELLEFIDKGVTPDDVLKYQEKNRSVASDKTDYRNDVVYKQGLDDLKNAKQNYLFIGGEATDDLAIDNLNTQLYLKAVEQYESKNAEDGANSAEILKEIKQPFIEAAVKKGFFGGKARARARAFEQAESITGMPIQAIDYTELSDDDLLKALE